MSEKNSAQTFALRVRRIVTSVVHWVTKASHRFDARIAALLARLVAAMEKSSWAANRPVAGWIDFLKSSDASHIKGGEGIVTHADPAANSVSASGVSDQAVRILSGGVRIAFVAFVAVLMILAWPKGSGPATSNAAMINTPTPTAATSLAIINPANMGDAESPADSTSSGDDLIQNDGNDGSVEVPMVVVNALPGSKLIDAIKTVGQDNEKPVSIEASSIASVPESGQESSGEVVLIDADMAGVESKVAVVPTPIAPFVNIISTINFDFTPTPIPQPTADVPPTPTPVPVKLEPGRLWSNFEPKAGNDHFWVERPFPQEVRGQLASPNYQFGSTAGGRYRIHHGIDISNPQGTPVRAATDGEVIHAGWDDPELIGPYNGFYGNVVVIQLDRRLPVAGGEMNVYVLYGHLSEVLVETGQRVQPDDIVGRVGMTGIAIGPHLHVEMRLGANTYEHSVDPYLWVDPKDDAGVVAVRLLTADGRTWPGARLSLARFEGGKAVWARVIETYRDTETIGPDPAWGENGAMGSVPPGYYVLAGNVNGERVRTELVVEPNQTTFVELRTKQ